MSSDDPKNWTRRSMIALTGLAAAGAAGGALGQSAPKSVTNTCITRPRVRANPCR